MRKLALLSSAIIAVSCWFGVANIARKYVFAQNIPNISSPAQVSQPDGNVNTTNVAQNVVWTPTQWKSAFKAAANVITFTNVTTGATAVRLTTDGNTANNTSGGNVGNLIANTTVAYTANCIFVDRTNRKSITYTFAESLIDSSGAGTVTVSGGNPSASAGPTIGGGFTLAAAPTITADNTNKGWNISYTPPTSNTDTMFAECVLTTVVAN